MVRGGGTADGVHPVEVRSQFAIASITKTVIAAEVMWLAEQGLLRLDDPVAAHLPPEFHFDTRGVTIRNLLSMESGIPDPAGSSALLLANLRRDWTPEEVLSYVPADRHKPGDHFVYEDSNYMLLDLVVQHTTGMSVAQALRAAHPGRPGSRHDGVSARGTTEGAAGAPVPERLGPAEHRRARRRVPAR